MKEARRFIVALGAANWRSLKVTEKVQSAVGNITGVSAVGDTATINATMRVNLAVQHLLAAARFSRDVGRLESEHKGQQFGEFWESIFHPAMACILTTVASLEAYANELFSDRKYGFSRILTRVDAQFVGDVRAEADT